MIYQYCIATNFLCCFLEEFHQVLLLASTWRPNLWVLRKTWLSECLPFENHFFLIIYQKVESWIPCHIYLYCIFSKNSALLKNYKILFPQKCFVFARYIANLQYLKTFVLDSFYNLGECNNKTFLLCLADSGR